jgi:hypothetical protein
MQRPEVKIGQVWQDCDKRMQGRRGMVRAFECLDGTPDRAILRMVGGRLTKIAIRRMYPHSTGWKLISDSPP